MMLCYSKTRKIKYFLDPPKKVQGYEVAICLHAQAFFYTISP